MRARGIAEKKRSTIKVLAILVALAIISAVIVSIAMSRPSRSNLATSSEPSTTLASTSHGASLVDTKLSANMQASRELQEIVDTFTKQYNKRAGVFVADLNTGGIATANADEPFVSASIYKMFVAYDVYRHVDAGTLNLQSRLGSFAHYQTIDECLDIMITISDNDCGAALGTLVGWKKLDALLKSEGYQNTVLDNYAPNGTLSKDKITNASDVGLLLHRLYNGTLLSKESTASFIQYLKDDEINQFLPSGLPRGTVIAHKIGYLYGFVHDAGIIYGKKNNVIVVLLSGEWQSPVAQSPPVFAQLSSAIWEWMEK